MSILHLSNKEKGFEEKNLDKFDIESIQGLVKGSPEALYLPNNVVLWKNPKAAVLNQEKTLVLKHEGELNDSIYGEVVVTGTDGTKTVGLGDDQLEQFRNQLHEVEVEGEKLLAIDY
ncbi:DUF3846 domain-containing protein [Salipaludibacillus daqingensis]|uniref:DUF3846 domain-containing protein n=1 Tax=Salipaludibacillus daqingensis TaxID=3041001 RepID=UPI002475B5D1|nr:DUF3846 domain-containing protein [Salipaludibacillus daqingensis]